MNHILSRALAVAAALGAVAVLSMPAKADGTAGFGFESLGVGAIGTGVPLWDVLPDVGTGITASFSSGMLASESPFTIQDNLDGVLPQGDFSNFTGLYLQENPGGPGGGQLTISFSHTVTFLSLNFGLLDPGGVGYFTDTDLNGTADGSAVDGYDFYEGNLIVNGSFNSITLFGNTLISIDDIGENYLNIDNFRLNFIGGTQDVPEPGTLALAAGLAIPVALSLRRRRK